MLPRPHRISGDLFDKIMNEGKVVHSPFFLARVFREKNGAPARVAAVVSVKVGKISAVRHLVKRRIYEAVRPLVPKMLPGNAVILLAKPTVLKLKPLEMQPDIEAVFVKAGVLR